MKVVRDQNTKAFLAAAGSMLYSREAEYGLILGLVEGLNSWLTPELQPPLLLRLEEEGQTLGALIQVRPQTTAVSGLDASMARRLAQYLVQNAIELPLQESFVGPRPGCSLLAQGYAAGLRGYSTKRVMAQKILRADMVIPPRKASGQMIVAKAEDLDTAFDFLAAFHQECLPYDPFDPKKVRASVLQKIERQTVFFWMVDGRPVASAHTSRPTKNGISIGAVYTEPAARAKGYASNLMANLTKLQLSSGKTFCVLYTDATNPTSNKVYESIGYRFLAESEQIAIKAAGH